MEWVEIKKVLEIVAMYCPDDDGSCSCAGTDLRELLDDIEALPTIKTEPEKIGRWIFKSRSKLINTGRLFVSTRVYTPKSLPASEYCEIPRGRYFFQKIHREILVPFCSRCGNRGGGSEYEKTKYCPECGARMVEV